MADKSHDINQWVSLSDYDLKSAEAMFKSQRLLYVLFCCQQALEKRLKALIVKTKELFPPRIHDLIRLSSMTGIKLSDTREKFLRRMANFYVGTRYPEEINRLAAGVTNDLAKACLDETKEFIEWLDTFLK